MNGRIIVSDSSKGQLMKTYLSIILLTLLSNLAYSFDSDFFEEQLKLAQQGDMEAQ
tara:strand:- start:1611 stop:1778 length:168 start_codon:yes stop_codon:yes gene_type:complete